MRGFHKKHLWSSNIVRNIKKDVWEIFKSSGMSQIFHTWQKPNTSMNKYRKNWECCPVSFFLAVQNSSIGDLVPCLVPWSGTTNNQRVHNSPEWPKRLVIFETFMTIFDDNFWWHFLMSIFFGTPCRSVGLFVSGHVFSSLWSNVSKVTNL